jgi:tetratricopeptide (TPR) repeat protein
VQFYRGEFGEAEATQRRAVALNPNNPEPVMQLGWRLAFAGQWNEGMRLIRQVVERSQAGDGWHHLFLAMDHYRRGDYRSGLAELKRLGGTFFFVGPALVAMCQAQLGHQEEARAALQEAMALNPTFAQDPRGAFPSPSGPRRSDRSVHGRAPQGGARCSGRVGVVRMAPVYRTAVRFHEPAADRRLAVG